MKKLRRTCDGAIFNYTVGMAACEGMEEFEYTGKPKAKTKVKAKSKTKVKAKAKAKEPSNNPATSDEGIPSSPASIVDDLNSDLGQTDGLHNS